MLAASCIAATFAMLTWILGQPPSRILCAIVVTLVALLLSVQHLLARPHVLVLPVMLAWAYGLLSASERGRAPSFWLLPLIALWANLHGGFVFGLVLVGGFALDALWNADRAQHKTVALRWAVFGVAALAACCVTPYGWGSILAARKILDLGELLHLDLRMDAGRLQQVRHVRDVDPCPDCGRALWRRKTVATADRAGAGPAAHGARP